MVSSPKRLDKFCLFIVLLFVLENRIGGSGNEKIVANAHFCIVPVYMKYQLQLWREAKGCLLTLFCHRPRSLAENHTQIVVHCLLSALCLNQLQPPGGNVSVGVLSCSEEKSFFGRVVTRMSDAYDWVSRIYAVVPLVLKLENTVAFSHGCV